MDPEYISDRLPDKLVTYLDAAGDDRSFRRRAVLTKANDKWELVACVVEGFLPGEHMPDTMTSRRYEQALLHEAFLTGAECLVFAKELHAGVLRLEGIELTGSKVPQWNSQLLPVNNDHMSRSGRVVSIRLAQSGGRGSVRTLLNPEHPYYPDSDTAARDWLPFHTYHGHSDGRNEQVSFLLPEARAFVSKASFSSSSTLAIEVAGSEMAKLDLLLKGARWEGGKIYHFEADVKNALASLPVPADAERFEYYLMDTSGTVYDFHREDQFSRNAMNATILGALDRSVIDQVRSAANEGEGQRIEFKPFIDLEKKAASPGQKTKLREVAITAVAFANSNGGHIYLGVDDDCSLTGVDQKLQEWACATLTTNVIEQYLGALKSKLKGLIQGELSLRVSHAQVDGATILVLEIPEANAKPACLQHDFFLYVRSGASNRRVPPDQWKMHLGQGQDRDTLFGFLDFDQRRR